VGVAVAVVYIADRRSREVAPMTELQPLDGVVDQASMRMPPEPVVASPPAPTPRPETAAPDKRRLRKRYALQGPSTKADPRLAKGLWDEARTSEILRVLRQPEEGHINSIFGREQEDATAILRRLTADGGAPR
jgi:hypothetical protein